jgi:hypothetical protein
MQPVLLLSCKGTNSIKGYQGLLLQLLVLQLLQLAVVSFLLTCKWLTKLRYVHIFRNSVHATAAPVTDA